MKGSPSIPCPTYSCALIAKWMSVRGGIHPTSFQNLHAVRRGGTFQKPISSYQYNFTVFPVTRKHLGFSLLPCLAMGKAALSSKKETHVAFFSPGMDRLATAGPASAPAQNHLAAFHIKAKVKRRNYFLPVLPLMLPSKILCFLCHKKVSTAEILK